MFIVFIEKWHFLTTEIIIYVAFAVYAYFSVFLHLFVRILVFYYEHYEHIYNI